jgi:hypothetical protein
MITSMNTFLFNSLSLSLSLSLFSDKIEDFASDKKRKNK